LRETEKEMGEIKIDINMIKMVNIDIDTEIEMEIKRETEQIAFNGTADLQVAAGGSTSTGFTCGLQHWSGYGRRPTSKDCTATCKNARELDFQGKSMIC